MASDAVDSPRRQNAQLLFEKGNEAALKSNFDYAIQMYQEACKLVPEALKYRQALRGIERRKFGNDPSKVGFLVGTRTQPIKLRIRTDKARKNWSHVLQTCEEVFVHSPWDLSATADAAEAAEQLKIPGLAVWLVESVWHQAADDLGFLRYSAQVLENNAQWAKAIQCWERIKKIHPSDEEAHRKINGLSASATITRSGLGEAIQRAGTQDAKALQQEAEELKKPRLSAQEQWIKEIQEQPDRPGAYLHLADALKAKGKLDDAEKVLARALKNIPGDGVVQQAHAEVQLARLRRAAEAWEKKGRENPDDPEAPEKLRQLREMLREYELKEVRRRVGLDPNHPGLRLQLGRLLAEAGAHDQAIAEYQQARNSPELKVEALVAMARSFEANGVIKLAERSLQDALKSADADDTAILNAIHYRLGRLAEAQGDRKRAEDHFNEVAANDYTYEDVAQRLKALNRKADD